MKSLIDTNQTKAIEWIIGGLAALGGVTAFIVYLETKKHKKLELEILDLDKSIKELQLYKLKNESPKV
jgi:hypothetical protein